MILQEILSHKREEVRTAKARVPLERLKDESLRLPIRTGGRPRFSEALRRGDNIAIIAEVKKASPSKGVIRRGFRSRPIGGNLL